MLKLFIFDYHRLPTYNKTKYIMNNWSEDFIDDEKFITQEDLNNLLKSFYFKTKNYLRVIYIMFFRNII